MNTNNNNNNNNIDSYSFTTEDQIKCYELLQSARMKDFIDVSFVRICHRTVANAFPDLMAECGGFRDIKSDKSMNGYGQIERYIPPVHTNWISERDRIFYR